MKIIFITDIHQNLDGLQKIDFAQYDFVLCGGDIIDPANVNLSIAQQIIDCLPEETIFVPGNVDKNDELLKMTEKFNNIDMKKITVTKQNVSFDFVGLGKARSLADDFVEYRRFFEADHNRVWDFLKKVPSPFILNACGIEVKDDKILFKDINQCLQDAQGFINKFAALDEEKTKSFFDSIQSLQNGIFVCHSPVRDALDQLPGLPPIGVVSARQAIERLQPKLVLCGHFHENVGQTKIGETTVVNPGALKDGKYAEINVENGSFECVIKSL